METRVVANHFHVSQRSSRQDANLQPRGRGLQVAVWAVATAVTNKTVATARKLLPMSIAFDQLPVSWHQDPRWPQGSFPRCLARIQESPYVPLTL